jgi:hypothetical protein
MAETARGYYSVDIDYGLLPYDLGHGITVHSATTLSLFGHSNSGPPHDANVCVSVNNKEERNVFSWLYAFEHAIHFFSGGSVNEGAYIVTRSGFEHHDRYPRGHWSGASKPTITVDTLKFATRTLLDFEGLLLRETFDRVSNAVRLYDAARDTKQPDFALLGFVGCLESLFSVATQELNFRLCLAIAKFSHDTPSEQQSHFSQLKKLYATRSKIAHGDKLVADEERAAIQLVDHWVPTAAEICRQVILRLFDASVVKMFNSRKQHERLLELMLFYPNLQTALSRLQSDEPGQVVD